MKYKFSLSCLIKCHAYQTSGLDLLHDVAQLLHGRVLVGEWRLVLADAPLGPPLISDNEENELFHICEFVLVNICLLKFRSLK